MSSTALAKSHAAGLDSPSATMRQLALDEPIRVMHLVYTLRPGGMEHGVVKIVNGLDPAYVASSICSTTPADTGMRQLLRSDVPVIELERRRGNDPRVVWSIYQTLRRHRPHVLHTHAWGTLFEGILAGRLARVPMIVHGEHGTLQLRPRQVRAQRWAWRHADRLLSVSSRLAERMSHDVGIPVDRVHVIRNGVNLSRFGAARASAAPESWGLAPGSVVIGAVGRLVDVKDHPMLIDAVTKLRTRGRAVVAVIAGDGPLREQLQAAITSAGLESVVRLLGHRPDVESVFAGLDIFVQSSKSEGMSNTILEAMASGLPVVTTRVGGADEMVVDGVTGLLVPAQDSESLADALDRLVSDEPMRRKMASAGKSRAQTDFSLDRMISGYQAFYLELLKRPGSRVNAAAG